MLFGGLAKRQSGFRAVACRILRLIHLPSKPRSFRFYLGAVQRAACRKVKLGTPHEHPHV